MTSPPPDGDARRTPRALTLAWWVVGLAAVAWAFTRGGENGGEGASPVSAAIVRAAEFDGCHEKTPAQLRKWLGRPESVDSVRPGAAGGLTSQWTWHRYVREEAEVEPTYRTITVAVESLPGGEMATLSCGVK